MLAHFPEHLKNKSLFSNAISQRLWTSYITGCLTPISDWLSRAFVHLLARHTLQLALRHHQARRHRWRLASHLIAFSSQGVARKSLDLKLWKPFHSTKHLCAIGFASIAHIVSYLCRIFLPPSFSTNAKLFFVSTHGLCQKSVFVRLLVCEVPDPFGAILPRL